MSDSQNYFGPGYQLRDAEWAWTVPPAPEFNPTIRQRPVVALTHRFDVAFAMGPTQVGVRGFTVPYRFYANRQTHEHLDEDIGPAVLRLDRREPDGTWTPITVDLPVILNRTVGEGWARYSLAFDSAGWPVFAFESVPTNTLRVYYRAAGEWRVRSFVGVAPLLLNDELMGVPREDADVLLFQQVSAFGSVVARVSGDGFLAVYPMPVEPPVSAPFVMEHITPLPNEYQIHIAQANGAPFDFVLRGGFEVPPDPEPEPEPIELTGAIANFLYEQGGVS